MIQISHIKISDMLIEMQILKRLEQPDGIIERTRQISFPGERDWQSKKPDRAKS
jgi:hypothetical protein